MPISLTILGCNSSLPTSEKISTAQLLNFNERYFLLDCAEGTQIQLRKYRAKFSKINNIFISHLHGDHYFGLFGLISTFNLLGRRSILNVYGPPQLKAILEFYSKNMERNIFFPIRHHSTECDSLKLIYEDRSIKGYSFPLYHRIKCYGFFFIEKEKEYKIKKDCIDTYNLSIKEIVQAKNGIDIKKENGEIIKFEDITTPPQPRLSYAFCSDTEFNPLIAEHIRGCRIIYHESTFRENMKARAIETKHSTAKQAAEIAKLAGAETLILGHFSSRYNFHDEFKTEAKEIFENTHLASDGKIFNFK